MKKITAIIVLLFSLISCKSKEEKQEAVVDASALKVSGQDLFEGEGNCTACHKPDQKIIGPSLQEIAKIYKEKNGSIVAFLKEQSDPLVDPTQYDVMKTNFAITKSMTDEQLQALEDYIYSFSK